MFLGFCFDNTMGFCVQVHSAKAQGRQSTGESLGFSGVNKERSLTQHNKRHEEFDQGPVLGPLPRTQVVVGEWRNESLTYVPMM